MNNPKQIDLQTAEKLIDFSGGKKELKNLADGQIEGVVAIHNMLVNPDVRFAYLADEVGMGKTYIALGVVAILRYFNPMLRVLYICPSRNVQEKWFREYKNFVNKNVQVSHGRLRTLDGRPATPYENCRNVSDLLRTITSGYVADYFIGMTSFSMSMSDDKSEWDKKIEELEKLVPAFESKVDLKSKHDVKEQYARALNYILPSFDLVIIDEAHNFKHDFQSSDRNRVLSGVLGFRGEKEGYKQRAKRALLLSATPYDRDLTQLRNQLNLVGRLKLFPEEIDDENKEHVREKMKNFMVRRLNTLSVNGEKLTRNMYRKEWRHGDKTEIVLQTDEQKLVTALVQKKVGEMLTWQTSSPCFQVGLLASFESFAESSKLPPVEFDSERSRKEQTDARDRHVIGRISDKYVTEYELGKSLPHPKMDYVVKKLSKSIFEEARKQLVFVRRVRSVDELKDKLDNAYNEWISNYIDQALSSHVAPQKMMKNIYEIYDESRFRDKPLLPDENASSGETLPGKFDTFFAWFFRGEIVDKAVNRVDSELKTDREKFPTPNSVRSGLIAKDQVVVTLLEPNWTWYICRRKKFNLDEILNVHGKEIAAEAGLYIRGETKEDNLDIYFACQIAFIKWLIDNKQASFLKPLYKHLKEKKSSEPVKDIDKETLSIQLNTMTLYTVLEVEGLIKKIAPLQSQLYSKLKKSQDKKHKDITDTLKRFDIHKALLSLILRTSHGIIDLYIARLKQGPANLTEETRCQWLKDFVEILKSQKQQSSFSTFCELRRLARNLDLIIKNNAPDIFWEKRRDYQKILSQSLGIVSPVIGASGATSGRSAQARKFRMPGYPLVLISTNVFQEGEDLHLFCDSVVHYGLSYAPVSLEQKVGRVDRVGSMAQRRLTRLKRPAEEKDKIQVTFPYVKESIETLQVRRLLRSYNEYIESLHDIVSDKCSDDDTVDIDQEIAAKDPIPEQIPQRLESPFKPKIDKFNDQYNEVELIEKNEKSQDEKVKHICDLLKSELEKRKFKIPENESVYFDEGHKLNSDNLTIKLSSAKASGELILSLEKPSDPLCKTIEGPDTLLHWMKKVSWPKVHRTYALVNSDKISGYDLYFKAEMLVGNSDITQQSEIKQLIDCMELEDIEHHSQNYQTQLPKEITKHVKSINKCTSIPIDRSGQTQIVVQDNNGTELIFNFRGSKNFRTQRVSLFVYDKRCIFLSQACSKEHSKQLPVEELIKYTWIRNRNIDIVEFLLNPNSEIVGRVVHPVASMQWEEFIFCAYTLAVETDRLEYILHKSDNY